MEAWVDLTTVQWAYAHDHQYSSEEHPKPFEGLEKTFGFTVVKGPYGSITRHNENGNNNRQILCDFVDENYLTMFLLRWTQ